MKFVYFGPGGTDGKNKHIIMETGTIRWKLLL